MYFYINKLSSLLYSLFYKLYYSKIISSKNLIFCRGKFNVIPFKKGKLKILLGEGSYFKSSVIVQGKGVLKIGDNSYVGSYSVIGVNNKISIGNNVMIADSVSIRDSDHQFSLRNVPMRNQGIVSKEIIIEDDVWIGYGAVVTKGVKIKKGAIIGANSVVTRDVDEFCIVGGVPARLIKTR